MIVFGGQIWPMRPKILCFTWCMWEWVATLNVQELYQWGLQLRLHIVVMREIRATDWAWLKMCGKHGQIWSEAEHCIKVWYSDSRTCFGQSVQCRSRSSLVPQHPVPYRNACELTLMDAMVRMADNGMGSNMYRCVRFPRSAKKFGFVVSCNMCDIMCEA